MIRSEISLNTSELRSEKFLLFAASTPQTVSSSVGKQISSRHPAVQLNCLIGHREVNNHTSANVHKYRANLRSHSRPLIFTSPQIVTSGNIIKNEYAPTLFFKERATIANQCLKLKLLNALFVCTTLHA